MPKAVSKDNIDMDLFEGALWAGGGFHAFVLGWWQTHQALQPDYHHDELGILGRKAEILVVTEVGVAK